MSKSFLLVSILFCIIIGASSCQHSPSVGVEQTQKQASTIEVTYTDNVGTALNARFDNSINEVTLTLSGHKVTLPKVVSASGAKYEGGVEIFWTKGSNAFYKKDGITCSKEQGNNTSRLSLFTQPYLC